MRWTDNYPDDWNAVPDAPAILQDDKVGESRCGDQLVIRSNTSGEWIASTDDVDAGDRR